MVSTGDIIIPQSVTLEEKTHTYYRNGKELLAVSDLIDIFKPEFDADKSIAKRVAAKRNITIKELHKEWDAIRDEAGEHGSNVHKAISEYLIHKKRPPKQYAKFVNACKKIKFKGILCSERIVFSKKYDIAGTVDLIEILDNNTINIYDFKTNKQIKKTSYPWQTKMLPPITHLDDCNLVHYTIQLSLYSYMLEEWGYWVRQLQLIHFSRTGNMVIYPIKYLRNTVAYLLKYYFQQIT